jgi:hypothetical protein
MVMEIGKPLFTYIVCLTMADSAFMGGALVTDAAGLPIEFRHTEPLVPSKLQRVLYGRALDAYMYNEVVISALLAAVEAKPQMYIAGDVSYVAGAGGLGVQAVSIAEARNVPAKEVGSRQDLSGEEFVLYLGPGNGPIRVKFDMRGDVASASAVRESNAKLLVEASRSMELVEPLRRVEDALRLIWDEHAKPQARAA